MIVDLKMEIELIDFSIEDEYEYKIMKVAIFREKDKMFEPLELGQPVMIKGIKVQVYRGTISLLSSYHSRFSIFPAAKPQWPIKSRTELPQPAVTAHPVKPDEAAYVALLQNFCSRDRLPSGMEYETKQSLSMNTREKFSELCNIEDHKFYDMIVEVIYIHRAGGSQDMVTVYVTDYSTNELFYNQTKPGSVDEGTVDDPYGYLAGKMPKPMKTEDGKDWQGPIGKMSLQITAFDQQGQYFLDYVKPKDWVKLSNVQIRFAMNGHLEGKLRNDRMYPDKMHIQPLHMPDDPTTADLRWKSAVKRKSNYFKRQKREQIDRDEVRNEAAGVKRKAEDDPPQKMNSRQRREAKRQAKLLKVKGFEVGDADSETSAIASESTAPAVQPVQPVKKIDEPSFATNKLVVVKKSWADVGRLSVTDILANRPPIELDEGVSVSTPFTNSRYRSVVRVVDYYPHNLEDFTVGKRTSEFDCLSDAETSSDEATPPSPRGPLDDHVTDWSGTWKWKWNFMIQVEDGNPKPATMEPKDRIWLSVNDDSGQHLLNLEPENLRTDRDTLATMKEKLFILWGDLEERKSAYLRSGEGKALLARTVAPDIRSPSPPPASTFPSTLASSPLGPIGRRVGEMPSDSEDEGESTKMPTQIPIPLQSNPDSPGKIKKMKPDAAKIRLAEKMREIGEKAQNKPFETCIGEFGVKVDDEADGTGYKRAWQLMDTFINH